MWHSVRATRARTPLTCSLGPTTARSLLTADGHASQRRLRMTAASTRLRPLRRHESDDACPHCHCTCRLVVFLAAPVPPQLRVRSFASVAPALLGRRWKCIRKSSVALLGGAFSSGSQSTLACTHGSSTTPLAARGHGHRGTYGGGDIGYGGANGCAGGNGCGGGQDASREAHGGPSAVR